MSVTHEQTERLSMPRDLREMAMAAHVAGQSETRPAETRWLRMIVQEQLGVDASSAPDELRPVGIYGRFMPAIELDGLWFCYDPVDGLCLLDAGTRYQVGSLAELGRVLGEIGGQP